MKSEFRLFPRVCFLAVCLCLFMALSAGGQTLQKDLASTISREGYRPNQLLVVFFDGPVFFHHDGLKEWKPVIKGQQLIDGDAILTKDTGWVVLSYSSENLLMVKPKSRLRFFLDPAQKSTFVVQMPEATVLLSARDGNGIQLQGLRGHLSLRDGEASYQTSKNLDSIKSLHGTAEFRLPGSAQPIKVSEGRMMEVDAQGHESALSKFDVRMEYDEFRRFNTYFRNFDEVNKLVSPEIPYRIDTVMINGGFVSSMETDRDGYRIIDPGANPAPDTIFFRAKITPYPRPGDRFELYIDKDLVYPLQEGRDGFYEARFKVPNFPEFFIKIHYLDSVGRRDRLFDTRFVFYNRRRKIEEVKVFFQQLSLAFARRDLIFLREHISRDYSDWFGNTYFDFTKLLDDTLRSYRDIRVVFHPHSFIFQGNVVKVNMNYRLSALTGNWNYRYEDMGADLVTLCRENHEWRLRAKDKGMFFQRMKVVIDPKRGVLKGKVTDESNQTPIRGALVKILKTSFQTQTDRFGEYVIYNIPPGKYDIEIAKNGYGKTTVVKVEILPISERF